MPSLNAVEIDYVKAAIENPLFCFDPTLVLHVKTMVEDYRRLLAEAAAEEAAVALAVSSAVASTEKVAGSMPRQNKPSKRFNRKGSDVSETVVGEPQAATILEGDDKNQPGGRPTLADLRDSSLAAAPEGWTDLDGRD